MKLSTTTLSSASLLLPLLLPALSTAAKLTVAIPPSAVLPNPGALPPSTHATLSSRGLLSAPLTRANEFVFADLAPGSYLLTVHCRDYAFEPMRVDVSVAEEGMAAGGRAVVERARAWQTFRGNEWDNLGEVRGEWRSGKAVPGGEDEGLRVEAKALWKKEYYQERAGFSVLSFLKNPMILMGLVSLGLIFGMPYVMDNMDPEMKAEFEEMQKGGGITGGANPASQLQNFDLASWMAGKQSGGAQSSGSQSQGGSSKKRS